MSDLQGTYFEADVTAINFSAQFSGSAHDVLGNSINGNNGGVGNFANVVQRNGVINGSIDEALI